MGNRIWRGALAGAIAAVIAWVASYPFLPVLMVSLKDLHHADDNHSKFFTLGTTYGWVSSGLFGLLASLFIVWVYTSDLPWSKRLLPCLIAMGLGPLWMYGGDMLSQSLAVWLNGQDVSIRIVMSIGWHLIWSLCLSIALCSSIVVSMAIRYDLVGRLFLAIGISTILCFVAKFLVAEVTDLFIIATIMNSSDGMFDYWHTGAPQFLGSQIAIGAAAGASLAIADIISRKAWIRLSLGAKEGYTWTVEKAMVIGTSELADVRIPRDGSSAPKHAQIDVRGGQYLLTHLGGPSPTMVNNVPVHSLVLNDQDIIRIGHSDLVFHIRNQRSVAASQAPVQTRSSYEPLSFQLIDPIGNLHPVSQGKTTVGRDARCELSLTWESTLSSFHAEVSLLVEELTIRDLGSTNGTKVNGSPVGTAPVPIKAGDVLELGSVKLKVQSNRPLL